MSMEAAQQTFIAESRELLVNMEAALLTLEKTPHDTDAVNAVFRAAHTIKGSGGVFGFDALVEFTHVMENVLDDIRAGRVKVDADLIALLLACGDHVSLLLDCLSVKDSAAAFAAAQPESHELQAQLNCYLENEAAGLPQVHDDLAHDADVQRIGGGDTVESDAWHISVRFGHNVLRHGMDPLSFIRYLATLGEIQSIFTRVRESGYINLRGEVLPLLRLRDVFETKGEPSKRENIVVVQYAGMQAGFVVDALMGEYQTVIKPLGKLFEKLSGISGSTILGTGEVALILDVPALVQKAVGSETSKDRPALEHRMLERR